MRTSLRRYLERGALAAAAASVVALAVVAPADAAETGEPRAAVYTAEGVRYEAVTGTLDELFPTAGASSSVAGQAPALVIDVVHPQGSTERLLVPGTEGTALETDPTLVYEEATSTLFVLWLARGSNDRSHVLFDALTDDHWSERISVTREAMVIETPPTLVLTRESTQRTVVHLAWAAEEHGGTSSFYSPIVLFRGQYAGWNPIVDLGRLDRHAPAVSTAPVAIYQAGCVADGVDLRSVVLATANEATGHLLTARSRVLPLGLVAFADEARNHLIGVGTGWMRTTRELAAEVANHLEDLDLEIHIGARAFLSRSARTFILQNAGVIAPTEALADALRRHLLEAGASLLSQEFEAAPQTCGLVEVGPDQAEQTERAAHVLEICRIRDRAIPEIGGDEVAIHASRDGGLVLLTWRAGGALWFRLSDEVGWSEPRSIEGDADVELLWHSLGR